MVRIFLLHGHTAVNPHHCSFADTFNLLDEAIDLKRVSFAMVIVAANMQTVFEDTERDPAGSWAMTA